ncbi:hypothetical protein CMK14_27630 [Candidatus Poribacteria bacterium]|nr:hypothetical protein [Candidatus Poribacteria bacterium]
MNEKLRIGVIGCDEISWKARCPGIVAAKNAEYAMVSNIREELAKELSLEYVSGKSGQPAPERQSQRMPSNS